MADIQDFAIPTPLEDEPKDEAVTVIIEAEDEGDATVTENEDGSVTVDFSGGKDDAKKAPEHDSNLAEYLDDTVLAMVGSDIRTHFMADKSSRKEWEETYTKGIDLLGLRIIERVDPWPGACGVFHPMLTEAIIRFQSQSITEIFPPEGPVKTKIIGKITPEVEAQAARVMQDQNHFLTEVAVEYRPDTERLLFNLPLTGSAFRKVYQDWVKKRPSSTYVSALDVYVPYGATDLNTAPRFTHLMRMPPNELKKLQVVGFYRDIDLGTPVSHLEETEEATDKATGIKASIEPDNRHHLLECCIEYDLPGYEDEDGIALPYIITIERWTGQVLAIRRNWEDGDDTHQKLQYMVHYYYLPGMGFYGLGLLHIIGGLTKSATSILRQLIDAGTLSNLPSGLKSRGLRIKGDDSPLMPGEFRDVDVAGGKIKDSITFLPYKEPSTVLYQLLGNLVEEGRRVGSIADMKASDMGSSAPVGTTLAIMERSLKISNAVQARLHASMQREFRIHVNLFREYMPDEYDFEVSDKNARRSKDYDSRIDVIPVSDPKAATMAQRIMQNQSAMQLSAQAPEIYDLPALHKKMLGAMGYDGIDEIIPSEDDILALDPVAENMAILTGGPVKAFLYQDHEAHIKVHMAMAEDPKILALMEKNPNAPVIAAAGTSHIMEHLAYQYRRDIEKQMGVELPPEGEALPEDVEVQMSRTVAEAAERLLQRDAAEQKAIERAAQEDDPLIQIQKAELQIKLKEVERKAAADQSRMQLEMAKLQESSRIKGAEMGVKLAAEWIEAQAVAGRFDREQAVEGIKMAIDMAKDAEGNQVEMAKLQEQQAAKGMELGSNMAKDMRSDVLERAKIDAQKEIAGKNRLQTKPNGG